MHSCTRKGNNCKRVGHVPWGDHTCSAVPNAKKKYKPYDMVLYRGNFAIINSAVAICWQLYLARFAVTIWTVHCLATYFPWRTQRVSGNSDNILSFIRCPQKHSCTQAKAQLPTSWYCTMSVCRRTKCSNCKPLWYCTDIILQTRTQQMKTFWHCTLIVLQWLYSKCIHYP